MRRIGIFLLIALCLTQGWARGAGLVRLHIIANSDSPADQMMKLRVRDEVLAVLAGLGPEEGTASQALQAVRSAEGVICQAARRAGFEGAVRVEAGWLYFEERELAGRGYPAGIYPGARIILGEGTGHNWWGLLNPELTQAAAGEGAGLIWHFPAILRCWFWWLSDGLNP